MSEYIPTLCSMCMHGVNVKKLWKCRSCGKRFCRHLVSRTREEGGEKTAVCLTCLSTTGGKGVL